MTIEEAIEHCKEVAAESRAAALSYARENAYETAISCKACGQEHEQLAEWLTELKQRREAEVSAPPKANGDKIRAMTDEELADIMQGQCACCSYQLTGCTERECKDGAYEWLKQEASEDAGTD